MHRARGRQGAEPRLSPPAAVTPAPPHTHAFRDCKSAAEPRREHGLLQHIPAVASTQDCSPKMPGVPSKCLSPGLHMARKVVSEHQDFGSKHPPGPRRRSVPTIPGCRCSFRRSALSVRH